MNNLIGLSQNLKSTAYFHHVRQRPDRAKIKTEWILETISNPVYTEIQVDGRIRKWRLISEEGKFLRVILLGGWRDSS